MLADTIEKISFVEEDWHIFINILEEKMELWTTYLTEKGKVSSMQINAMNESQNAQYLSPVRMPSLNFHS